MNWNNLLLFWSVLNWYLLPLSISATRRGKLSEKAHLKDGNSTKDNGTSIVTYKVTFHVEPEFGIPGALVVKNGHKHEFFLNFVTLDVPNNLNVHFECKSWVYPRTKTESDRLFFSNKVCFLVHALILKSFLSQSTNGLFMFFFQRWMIKSKWEDFRTFCALKLDGWARSTSVVFSNGFTMEGCAMCRLIWTIQLLGHLTTGPMVKN